MLNGFRRHIVTILFVCLTLSCSAAVHSQTAKPVLAALNKTEGTLALIDPATMKALVPNLILQPLTENAIRHGISRSADAGLVGINSAVEDGHLRLTVYDNGAGLPTDWQLKGSAGIGLANTAARLQQLYDDDHEFDIRNRDGGGVEVVIRMPLKTSA
jgi:LytS/YehU family sensor histidine kinase